MDSKLAKTERTELFFSRPALKINASGGRETEKLIIVPLLKHLASTILHVVASGKSSIVYFMTAIRVVPSPVHLKAKIEFLFKTSFQGWKARVRCRKNNIMQEKALADITRPPKSFFWSDVSTFIPWSSSRILEAISGPNLRSPLKSFEEDLGIKVETSDQNNFAEVFFPAWCPSKHHASHSDSKGSVCYPRSLMRLIWGKKVNTTNSLTH